MKEATEPRDEPTKEPRYLNGTQLARALGHGINYVTAMKRAGYEFELPGNRTSLAHAVAWLKSVRRQFVAQHYLAPGWESRPTLIPDGERQMAEAGDR